MTKINSDMNKILYKIRRDIEKFKIDIGVLENRTTGKAIPGSRKNFHGITGRIASRIPRDKSNQLIAAEWQEKNYFLIESWSNGNNKEVQKVLDDLCRGLGNTYGGNPIRRIENNAAAVVKNPILRGDYGRKASNGVRMIDTGSLYNSITAKVVVGA